MNHGMNRRRFLTLTAQGLGLLFAGCTPKVVDPRKTAPLPEGSAPLNLDCKDCIHILYVTTINEKGEEVIVHNEEGKPLIRGGMFPPMPFGPNKETKFFNTLFVPPITREDLPRAIPLALKDKTVLFDSIEDAQNYGKELDKVFADLAEKSMKDLEQRKDLQPRTSIDINEIRRDLLQKASTSGVFTRPVRSVGTAPTGTSPSTLRTSHP